MPKRVQRRRFRDWRMPEGVVYVGRPTQWGSEWPFNPKSETSRRVSVAHYRRWLKALLASDSEYARRFLEPLVGKDLACWCPLDKPCHADVLLDFANSAAPGLPHSIEVGDAAGSPKLPHAYHVRAEE